MPATDHDAVRRRVEAHLTARLDDSSPFFKSKYIAAQLDLSVKRVGAAMAALRENSTRLDITPWGGSSDGTTWYVTAAVDDGEPEELRSNRSR